MTAPIIAGAEPESFSGGPNGALVLHGFTGNPLSMRGVARALAAAGFTVDLPLLPGHGTVPEDLAGTDWDDWTGAAERAFLTLADKVDGQVVVVGLSMGGAVACHLATKFPSLAGIVVINGVVTEPAGIREILDAMIANGDEMMDAIGNDIADPEADELAYTRTSLKSFMSLVEAMGPLGEALPTITCPTLIITSAQDHTVEPSNSDVLAGAVSGPVERLTLDRSFHVATLDYDKDEVERATVDFATRVTG